MRHIHVLSGTPEFRPLGAALLLFLLSVLFTASYAQSTILFREDEHHAYLMEKEHDLGLYGRSARSAGFFLLEEEDNALVQTKADASLLMLRSQSRMDYPAVDQKLLAFYDEHNPAAIAHQALLLIGGKAYEDKQYDEAIKYLSQVDPHAIRQHERSSLNFKLGYSLFVRKEFDQAARFFADNREIRDKYYYPSHYYYGMTQYFKGNYTEAISSFEKVAPSEFYKDFIPYYIIQIHFNNQDYQQVIGYGNHVIESPSIQNKKEIRHLIGQAYFESGDHASAIPHLEYVEQHSEKLHPDDFYQLGIAYYQSGRYSDAIRTFLQIRNETGTKAHYANYYLGHSYLMTGDKTSARNSLRNAMQLEDVPQLSVEATFHYGRLSAEAGDDKEAIRVLQTIPSSSPDYASAQKALADILTSTTDYNLAISEIEAMASLTPAMKGAYQKVTLYKAEQLMQENNPQEAKAFLEKSLKYPADKNIQARAYFWMGELMHADGNYSESIRWYDQYFETARQATDLPIHQSIAVAHYNQGYNYLSQENFSKALTHFENAVSGLQKLDGGKQQAVFLSAQLLPDVLLRAGDVAFKLHKYDKALQFFDQSIQRKSPGYDYATYQKAMIKGLQKRPLEKIALMESIATMMPASLWVDDALWQTGVTYQEENESAKAVTSYERIVNLKPQSPLLHKALLRLGLLSYNNSQFEEAVKYYRSVFEYKPDPQTSKEAIAALQEIYVNEMDQPEKFFEFASSIPGYAITGSEKDSILYTAAENHYAQGNYEKAAEAFRQYVGQMPKGVYAQKAMFLRAESLSLLKEWPEALTAYEALIKEGPGPYHAPSLYKAALIAYNYKEDMARAYQYYIEYLPYAETGERQVETLTGALHSAFKAGKSLETYDVAGKILAHSRTTDDIRTLAYYYSATLALQNKDIQKAIDAFNEVIRINSTEYAAEARYKIASIYDQEGDIPLAMKLSEEAAKANVGYPYWVAKSLILLSDLHFRTGDLLNAKAIIEAILENFKGDEAIVKEATEKLQTIHAAEKGQSRIKDPNNDELELHEKPKKD